MLLNTSLNDAGEPLVESFGDLLSFLETRCPDVVYAGPWRFARPDHSTTSVNGGPRLVSAEQ